MRLLLDTHALLWLAHEPEALSASSREAIVDSDNEVYVSAVSAIEIATKFRKGALEYRTSLATDFSRLVMACGFGLLSITCDHAQRAGNLPDSHKDPWDRLLVAQAQIENLTLVSVDKKIAALGAVTYW